MVARLVIVFVLMLFFLGVALWGVDLQQIVDALLMANWWIFIPVFLCYLCAHATRTMRIWVLLGYPSTFYRMFAINTVGFLAINVVPLRLGEMVRPYLLAEREGIPFTRGLAAVLLERLLDMVMLLVMLMGLTWVVDLPDTGVLVAGVDIVSAAQAAVALMCVIGIFAGSLLVLFGERLLRRLELAGPLRRVVPLLSSFREGLAQLFARPVQAVFLLSLSAVIWGVTICSVYFALQGFEGLPNGFEPAWTVWTITLSGLVVAPTPGFVGVYQVFCVAALWIYGVEKSLATTFSLVLHAGQLIFTIVLGVVFLILEGVGLRELIKQSQMADADAVISGSE